ARRDGRSGDRRRRAGERRRPLRRTCEARRLRRPAGTRGGGQRALRAGAGGGAGAARRERHARRAGLARGGQRGPREGHGRAGRGVARVRAVHARDAAARRDRPAQHQRGGEDRMIRALYTAATGMQAQQLNIDVIANNLANVNTAGFKKSRADFQDLLYQTIRAPGSPTTNNTQSPTGIQVGLGARPAAVQRINVQGDYTQTGNALDMAVEGTGFFQVTLPDGTTAFTRAGAFKLDNQSRMVTS